MQIGPATQPSHATELGRPAGGGEAAAAVTWRRRRGGGSAPPDLQIFFLPRTPAPTTAQNTCATARTKEEGREGGRRFRRGASGRQPAARRAQRLPPPAAGPPPDIPSDSCAAILTVQSVPAKHNGEKGSLGALAGSMRARRADASRARAAAPAAAARACVRSGRWLPTRCSGAHDMVEQPCSCSSLLLQLGRRAAEGLAVRGPPCNSFHKPRTHRSCCWGRNPAPRRPP